MGIETAPKSGVSAADTCVSLARWRQGKQAVAVDVAGFVFGSLCLVYTKAECLTIH